MSAVSSSPNQSSGLGLRDKETRDEETRDEETRYKETADISG